MMLHPRIKELRLERELSQKEVAEALGCSEKYYAKIEQGIDFNSIYLRRLSLFYDVCADYLVGFSDERRWK